MTIFHAGPMTLEQCEAHRRLLAALLVRTVAEDPKYWDERERPLSDEEIPYLLEGNA